MKYSPSSASSPLHRPSPVCAMPSSSQASLPNYSSVSNGIPPVTIIDETTSDVPLLNNMLASTFVPKIEDTCTNSSLYTMDSMVNSRTPTMMNNRAPMINENSSTVQEGAPLINGTMPSSSRNKFMPNAFVPPSKNTPPDGSWWMNPESYGTEPNIDNWLGQIFKSDNLVAGCSLPQMQAK